MEGRTQARPTPPDKGSSKSRGTVFGRHDADGEVARFAIGSKRNPFVEISPPHRASILELGEHGLDPCLEVAQWHHRL
jgi:hypothetical protein